MKALKIWRYGLGILFLISCKKNPKVPDETQSYQPTPYKLEYPVYFGKKDSIEKELLKNPLTVEGVELGRYLFYDPILSENYSISCASCHQQAYGFSDPRRYSLGTRGLPGKRQSMALANLMWQNRFFWDGRAMSIEEQVLFPIQDHLEMNMDLPTVIQRLKNSPFYVEKFNKAFPGQEINTDLLSKALAQFLKTLISKNSKYDLYKQGLYTPTAEEREGMRLFIQHPYPDAQPPLRGANCGDCHIEPHFGGNIFKNNGLDSSFADLGLENVTGNPLDKAKFKVPSLRNIALTSPYMHDGRFNSLHEVVEFYDHQVYITPYTDPLILEASNVPFGGPKLFLTPQEKQYLIAFLNMLTDTVFTKNPAFSNPF